MNLCELPAARTPRILIIAGSDSGGGAGIQADIKTVTMLGGHAMTAVTAITAQNTLGVDAVELVSTAMVLAQIDAVARDIGVDAIKIGMIGSAKTAHAVADRLDSLAVPIVFDPVMVTTSGSALADSDTIAAFEHLMRIATVTTPNVVELAALGGDAAALVEKTGSAILAKGGDAQGAVVVDRLVAPDDEEVRFDGSRIESPHNHGTGCTLSSAIAVGLARGLPLVSAIDDARLFVRLALREAPGFGAGHGPMGHQAVRLDIAGDAPMLNQVTVGMRDYSASVDFYRRLGLRQIVEAPPHYARFETSGGATFSLDQTETAAGGATVYFEFADLDAAVARLSESGLVVDEPPSNRDWRWREARLTDPAGTRICLYRAGEDRRFPPWRIA